MAKVTTTATSGHTPQYASLDEARAAFRAARPFSAQEQQALRDLQYFDNKPKPVAVPAPPDASAPATPAQQAAGDYTPNQIAAIGSEPSSDFSTTDQVNGGEPPAGESTPSDFIDAGEGTEERAARLQAESDAIQTDLSDSFLAARGTFYRVPLRTGTGPGLYAVEGLSQFIDNARKEKNEQLRRRKFDSRFASPTPVSTVMQEEDPESYYAAVNYNEQIESENARRQDEDRLLANDKNTLASTPVLIMGIEITQTDIISAVSCLNNIKVFYTFGQAFGNVVIRGEMLLGPLGSIQSDGVRVLSDYFNQQRVSNLKKPTTFSVAQTAYKMYMSGLMIGNVDVEFHVLPFVITGILIDPSNQASSLLNPANQIIATDQVTEVTTTTIRSGAAEAAQNVQVTASTQDATQSIADYRLANPAPQYDSAALSPDEKAKVLAAFDDEQAAEATGDFAATKAAIDNRNQTIQSAVEHSRVGEQTTAAAKVQDAIKAAQNDSQKNITAAQLQSLSTSVNNAAADRTIGATIPGAQTSIQAPVIVDWTASTVDFNKLVAQQKKAYTGPSYNAPRL